MEEAGDIAQAAAMSLLILFINILVRIIYELVIKLIKNKFKDKQV
jgi:iron(III) transport system permease protein